MYRLLEGKFYKNGSGRESYEIMDANSLMILKISQLLLDRHDFRFNLPVIGLDQVFMSHHRDHLRLTVGWDNWSGCFVQADNAESDEFVFNFCADLDPMMLVRPLQGYFAGDRPRVCYEIYYASEELVPKLLPLLVREFRLYQDSDGHLVKASYKIKFGWEQWRGCYLEAVDESCNALMKEIADFLNTVILEEL